MNTDKQKAKRFLGSLFIRVHPCSSVFIRGRSSFLEPCGSNPEALFPLAAWGDALQIFVDSGVRQAEGVGNRRHRLEADELASRRRVHHRYRELRPVADSDPDRKSTRLN